MPGCIVSATTASFRSVEKRRRRATPVMTSTFENVSDIGVCLGLYLGPPAKAGVRSKRGAVHKGQIVLRTAAGSALGGGVSCNPSTKQFEQTMTVSGDRLYLVRKAVQVNIVFSGTVSSDGTVSGSGIMARNDPAGGVNLVQMLNG